MKKRTVVALLAMILAMNTTACMAEKEEIETEDTQAVTDAEAQEPIEVSEPEGFGSRLVSVDHVEKYIKLGEYKGLVLEKPSTVITDEQIDEEILYNLQNTMTEVTGANETAQEGDTVTINFVGLKDGVAFDGGSAENFDLTLGEGGMIDGFEDGIFGMKKGETKDLELTFPEDYFEESLAGEDVVFQITLQKIQRAPELSDEWVAANSDVKTIDEYRSVIAEELKEYAEQDAENTMEMNAWDAVYSNSEVKEYPEADIQNAKEEFYNRVMDYIGDPDMTLEEFIESQEMSMENFEEQSLQYAQSKVKQNLIIQGIMDAEKLTLDDPESLEILDMLVEDFEAEDAAELVSLYSQVEVNETIGLLRVEKFMVDNATINEAVVDAGDDDDDDDDYTDDMYFEDAEDVFIDDADLEFIDDIDDLDDLDYLDDLDDLDDDDVVIEFEDGEETEADFEEAGDNE